MGNLTLFLQKAWHDNCPQGWECFHEKRLLNKYQETLLGYSPRADVLLSKQDGTLRLWVEFEISRADPVANHAKFATAHIYFPWLEPDVFLSMVSSHVDRGRSNLAANTIWLMRRVGLQAYQTSLLPHYGPQSISRLNYLPLEELFYEDLPVKYEIERAITVTQPMSKLTNKTLYFVANLMEVMHNVAQWNHDMKDPGMQSLWGKRRVTYFVYNPHIKQFAPSKFCAYISVGKLPENDEPDVTWATMTIPLYVNIPWGEPIFDGNRARRHLGNNLAMRLVKIMEMPDLYRTFNTWYQEYRDFVIAPIETLSILLPPTWY